MRLINNFKDIYNLYNLWSENCPPKLPNFNVRVPAVEKLKTYKLVTAFDKTLKFTPFEYDKNKNMESNMFNRLNGVENIDKITESSYIITPYNFFQHPRSDIARTINTVAMSVYLGLMMTFYIHGSDLSGENKTELYDDIIENDGANIEKYSLLMSSLLLRTYYGNNEPDCNNLDNSLFCTGDSIGHFCIVNYADWLTDYLVLRGHNREKTKTKVLDFTKTASYHQLLHGFSNSKFD